MSQQIDETFSKYKKVFKAQEEEISNYLLRHYEKAFLSQKVINVERKDATDRIKVVGFNKDMSSWRNHYKNIVVSTCIKDNGTQKRYDYKFFFTKEKLKEDTIEIIEDGLKESNRLKIRFQFDDAITKIDEMLELIQKKHDEIFNKILNDARSEIVAAKEKHDKTMEQIIKLEEKININRKIDNLKAAVNDCEKIIEFSSSINRGDIASKYREILSKTQNEIETRKAQEAEKPIEEKKALKEKRAKERYDKVLEQIAKLEEGIKINRENGNLKAIMNACEEIIELSELINRNDIAEKYKVILEDIMKELEAQKALEKDKALEAKLARKEEKELKEKQLLEKKNALKEQKAQERAKALAEKQALKEQKAQEKAKALADKKALNEKKAQEKNAQILEQIAKLEENLKKNQEIDNLSAVISDCEKIINLANSINEQDLVEKFTNILEEAKKELGARTSEENAKALAEKDALKEQKAQERAKALAEKQALKEQKAQEKAKALADKKVLEEKKAQEKNAQILEQIAKLEENLKNNQETDNLSAVISDCEKIINLANSINKEALVEEYTGILEEARKKLEARKAEENSKTIEEKQALKERKAQEKAKALAEKQDLKEQKAQAKAKALADKKALEEKKSQEKYTQILEEIIKLEEDIKSFQEIGNLTAVVNDCEKIINLANSVNKEAIVENYTDILAEARKELEAGKAEENGKKIAEKQAIKEKKAQEKAEALAKKQALKEQKAQEKEKALEEKQALKEQKQQKKEIRLTEKSAIREENDKERYERLLEQISKFEEDIKDYQETNDLTSIAIACEKIIRIAKLISRKDIAQKYSILFKMTKKEMLSQIKANSIKEEKPLKEKKLHEKEKSLERKNALREAKALKKKEALEKKKVLNDNKAQEKEKALAEKKALREQEKYDFALKRIPILEAIIENNLKNDNLKAVIRDSEKIIELAKLINNEDLIEKFSAVLAGSMEEVETQKTNRKSLTDEEKQAQKERKANEKAKLLADKKALDEIKAQVKQDQILGQIAKLEENVKIYRETDNIPAIVSNSEKIIKLANSINEQDLVEKYTNILEEARKEQEARKTEERAKALAEKQALKTKKTQQKAKALAEKQALMEQKVQEKAKALADKKAFDEKKVQERNTQTLEQIAKLEENVKFNQENDNIHAIISECEKIINLANSIRNQVLGETYTGILEEARKELDARKAQENAKTAVEKRALNEKKAQEKAKAQAEKLALKKQKSQEKARALEEKSAQIENATNKPLMILNIIGGLFMILSGIANIILLFNMIYVNIIPIIGTETADTFFIFLYVNGCICIIGGILVIFGSLEVISNYFKPGKSLISFGLTVDLIGSMMLLLVGLWAGALCGSPAAFIMNSIWIFFSISVVAILIAIISLKKIKEKKVELLEPYYVGIKKDKVIEKKVIRE